MELLCGHKVHAFWQNSQSLEATDLGPVCGGTLGLVKGSCHWRVVSDQSLPGS